MAESPSEFEGPLLRAAMEALHEAGLSPAILELAGPSEERRIEEALARATGLDAASQGRLRDALVAVGDDASDVVRVRALAPGEEVSGAVAVGHGRYRVERLEDEEVGRKARRGRSRTRPAKPAPALVTIVRASERQQRPAPSAEPRPPAEAAQSSAAAPPHKSLPAGRGRFTSGGRLESGGTPGEPSWSRPTAGAPARERPGAPPPGKGRGGGGRGGGGRGGRRGT